MNAEWVLRNAGLYSVQVAILIAAGALLPWVFRLRVPSARLAVWYAVLAVCIALPLVAPWHQLPMEPANHVTFSSVPLGIAGDAPAATLWLTRIGWAGAVLLLLAAGTLVRFGLLLLGLAKLRRLRNASTPAPAAEALDRAPAIAGAWADFRISAGTAGPVTFGFRHPLVLLPPGFFELDPAQQETVAVHELLHVKRGDWLFTLAEEILRALLWFHPAIWFALNRVQLVREQSVDEAVVRATRRSDEYVDALLKIAAARIEPDLAPAPLLLRKRHLRERVAAIVEGVTMSKPRLVLSVSAVLLMLPVVAGILAWQLPLQASPQEVRDADGVQVRTGPFKVLHRAPVEYPADARAKGIAGGVVAAVAINGAGEVTDARIVSGPAELRKPVLESVLGWHFATDPVEIAPGSTRPVPPSFEVAVMFAAPGGPPSKNPVDRVPNKSVLVNRIDLSSLPQALRDKVEPSLTIRPGEVMSPERFAELSKNLASIDRHLSAHGAIRDGDSVDLAITLGEPHMVPGQIRLDSKIAGAKLVKKVVPKYPPDAKAAGVQGVVRLEATLAKDGSVRELKVLSGDPLLVPSATEAVHQWVYSPTLLNGEPVEVITQIDVNYTLAP